MSRKPPEPIYRDQRGIVTYFNESKGFGFVDVAGVRGSGTRGEVFVHKDDVVGFRFPSLLLSEEVVVDIVQTAKGLKAVNVRSA